MKVARSANKKLGVTFASPTDSLLMFLIGGSLKLLGLFRAFGFCENSLVPDFSSSEEIVSKDLSRLMNELKKLG